jgi:hypothetical protein
MSLHIAQWSVKTMIEKREKNAAQNDDVLGMSSSGWQKMVSKQ